MKRGTIIVLFCLILLGLLTLTQTALLFFSISSFEKDKITARAGSEGTVSLFIESPDPINRNIKLTYPLPIT